MALETLTQYQSKPKFKLYALLINIMFIVTSIVQPGSVSFAAEAMQTSNLIQTLMIPQDMGTIREMHLSEKDNAPVVVHIQDAHVNYEAQKNISRILETLQKKYTIDDIYVEGSTGDIDVSFYRAFPLQDEKASIVDGYMQEGSVSGPEYYAITSETPVSLYGVDNEDAYVANVKHYLSATAMKDDALAYIDALRTVLVEARQTIFSPALLQFIEKKEAFLEKTEDPLEYIRQLMTLSRQYDISLKKYKHFSHFEEIEIYQKKIDTKAVNAEVRALIENDLMAVDLADADTQALAFKEMDIKAGRISAYEFYAYLRQLAVQYDIDFKQYANLNLYVNYLSLVEDVDARKLYGERVRIEKAILKHLFASEEEKELFFLNENASILEKVVSLQATPEDLKHLRRFEKLMTNEAFASFLSEQGYAVPQTNFSIQDNLAVFEKFYKLAESREDALVKKALKQMKKTDESVSVLFAGGYHTAGIKERLQDADVSYFVVSPRIVEVPKDNMYEKIMSSYDGAFGVAEGTRGGTVAAFSAIQVLPRTEANAFLVDQLTQDFAKKGVKGINDKVNNVGNTQAFKIDGYKNTKDYFQEWNFDAKQWVIVEDKDGNGYFVKVAKLAEMLPRYSLEQLSTMNNELGFMASRRKHAAVPIDHGALSQEQADIVDLLFEINQEKLFEDWDPVGKNEDKKRDFLDQSIRLNGTYPGGLKNYYKNLKNAITKALEKGDYYEGADITLSDNVFNRTEITDELLSDEQAGLQVGNKTVFVIVAGGVGDRLGYPGIKVGVPMDISSQKTFLQYYCEYIKTIQDKSNALNNEARDVDFVIMVSDQTEQPTIDSLKENNYFGLKASQVHLIKQEPVVAVAGIDGSFAKTDTYTIATKPHGHGDIHMLLYSSGLAKKFVEGGAKQFLFFQDTNINAFNAALPTLGVSEKHGVIMNSVAVRRKAGEKLGALANVKFPGDDTDYLINMEYNKIEKIDTNDETGYSPLPGNINVLAMSGPEYVQILAQTEGFVEEMVNIKKDKLMPDGVTMEKGKEFRVETNMQDIALTFCRNGYKVAATSFNPDVVFSTLKNEIVVAVKNSILGTRNESMPTAEHDRWWSYAYWMHALADVGFAFDGEPELRMTNHDVLIDKIPESVVHVPDFKGKIVAEDDIDGSFVNVKHGVVHKDVPILDFSPVFIASRKDVQKKFSAGSISNRSALSVGATDVKFENMNINGAVTVTEVKQGSSHIVLTGLIVENKGWEKRYLSKEELDVLEQSMEAAKDDKTRKPITPEIFIRGYEIVKHDALNLIIEDGVGTPESPVVFDFSSMDILYDSGTYLLKKDGSVECVEAEPTTGELLADLMALPAEKRVVLVANTPFEESNEAVINFLNSSRAADKGNMVALKGPQGVFVEFDKKLIEVSADVLSKGSIDVGDTGIIDPLAEGWADDADRIAGLQQKITDLRENVLDYPMEQFIKLEEKKFATLKTKEQDLRKVPFLDDGEELWVDVNGQQFPVHEYVGRKAYANWHIIDLTIKNKETGKTRTVVTYNNSPVISSDKWEVVSVGPITKAVWGRLLQDAEVLVLGDTTGIEDIMDGVDAKYISPDDADAMKVLNDPTSWAENSADVSVDIDAYDQQLESIISGRLSMNYVFLNTARELMTFSELFNYLDRKSMSKPDQKKFDEILVKKSKFARDMALEWLQGMDKMSNEYKETVSELLLIGLQQIERFGEKKVANGDITEKTYNTVLQQTKRILPEWLDANNNIPKFVIAGLIRGIMEGRSEDILYDFSEWRLFGTAGIRNPAVQSKFGAIADLELSEFSGREKTEYFHKGAMINGDSAPVLTGSNLMNIITIIQQEQAIVNVYREVQAAHKAGADVLDALIKEKQLDPRFVSDIVNNNKVSIAYDSRLNGKYFAHMLAAAFLKDGIKVDLFDRPAGVPPVVYQGSEDPENRSAIGILISASHSEANYNGFKAFIMCQRSQVDKAGKNIISGQRKAIVGDSESEKPEDVVLPYLMRSEFGAFTMEEFDVIFKAYSNPDGEVRLKWFGKKDFNVDTERAGCAFDNEFYDRFYKHIEEFSPVKMLDLTVEEKEKVMAAKYEMELFYTAFSGCGAVNAQDFPGFLNHSGYTKVKFNDNQTLEHDGRFAGFNKPGGDFGMPDPGVVKGWLVNFVEFFQQEAGETMDVEKMEAAIEHLNKLTLALATDPDIDRAGMMIPLSDGMDGGNIKAPLIKSVVEKLQSLNVAEDKIAMISNLIQEKMNDQLLLTANEAWSFIVFQKFMMMHERGKLSKDKLYVIEKSHVTTDQLTAIAAYFREKFGYQIYVVDTYVGFTELAKKSRDLFKIARGSWMAHQQLAQMNDKPDVRKKSLNVLLGQLESLNAELKTNVRFDARGVPFIDEGIALLRTYLETGNGYEQAMKQLSIIAHMEIPMGVEESNGYGEFGVFTPNEEFIPSGDDVDWDRNEVGVVEKEHISEKDGSLAAYEMAEILAIGKAGIIDGKSKTPIQMYLDMVREVRAVGTDNRFINYVGLTGGDKKLGAMRYFEQTVAPLFKAAIDEGKTVTLFNGEYMVKEVQIFRDAKYDNFWTGFPEEGVRLTLENKDGSTLFCTYRPSGTGANNRAYSWVFGADTYKGKKLADMNYMELNEYRVNIVATLDKLAMDFFGEQDKTTGYAALPKESFQGWLSALGEVNPEQYGDILPKVVDDAELAKGLSPVLDSVRGINEKLANAMVPYINKKTGRFEEPVEGEMTDKEREKWEAFKSLRTENMTAWDEVVSASPEMDEALYVKFIPANPDKMKTIYVPQAYAMSWQTSLIDCIMALSRVTGADFVCSDPEIQERMNTRYGKNDKETTTPELTKIKRGAIAHDDLETKKILATVAEKVGYRPLYSPRGTDIQSFISIKTGEFTPAETVAQEGVAAGLLAYVSEQEEVDSRAKHNQAEKEAARTVAKQLHTSLGLKTEAAMKGLPNVAKKLGYVVSLFSDKGRPLMYSKGSEELSPIEMLKKVFLAGGYKQPGYGVAAGAAVDGNFAIDDEGDQGYFVNKTTVKKDDGSFKSGKDVFVDTVNALKTFLKGCEKRSGKPIKLIIKPGIGGQHTDFQGVADVFEVIDAETGLVVGEFELGKDYGAYLQELTAKMGISYDQIAIIPSSKSGSTDETMMVFVAIFSAMMGEKLDKSAAEISDTVLAYFHDINFRDGKEIAGKDLFKGFNLGDFAARIDVTAEQALDVLKGVLGNMFLETTDRPSASRLSAFIRNSGLDEILGDAKPGFGAMYDNVGGRWTADLHMMTFLAFHDLDPEPYWQARYDAIKQVRAGKHLGVEMGDYICDNNVEKIALIVPPELFWFGKGKEQNFNESIWQEGFANLKAISTDEWNAQKKYYANNPDAMIINLSDLMLDAEQFNIFNINPIDATTLSKPELAIRLADLFTTFYGMTHTVGNRLIARAIAKAGLDINDLDISDLRNPATQILQDLLYVRQPYVELGKGLLQDRLEKLQVEQREWERTGKIGLSPIERAIDDMVQKAGEKRVRTNMEGLGISEGDALTDMGQLATIIYKAVQQAKAENRTFVPFIYLEGKKFRDLRKHLVNLGIEWVLQGTGDQHISYQQVLAQPQAYLPFFISFVPEKENIVPGSPAIGFAKGYLDNISSNMVRDYFAEASYEALTVIRKDAGGKGFFIRILDTKDSADEIVTAFDTATERTDISLETSPIIDVLKGMLLKGDKEVVKDALDAILKNAEEFPMDEAVILTMLQDAAADKDAFIEKLQKSANEVAHVSQSAVVLPISILKQIVIMLDNDLDAFGNVLKASGLFSFKKIFIQTGYEDNDDGDYMQYFMNRISDRPEHVEVIDSERMVLSFSFLQAKVTQAGNFDAVVLITRDGTELQVSAKDALGQEENREIFNKFRFVSKKITTVDDAVSAIEYASLLGNIKDLYSESSTKESKSLSREAVLKIKLYLVAMKELDMFQEIEQSLTKSMTFAPQFAMSLAKQLTAAATYEKIKTFA